ncbi:hypothetical protein M434DRAFT_397180 [Hypoxylon sp. CO27-5]|nr:hypothetical protein M434DRAFT_397180 [Hypoxylon sp. CO27-5]
MSKTGHAQHIMSHTLRLELNSHSRRHTGPISRKTPPYSMPFCSECRKVRDMLDEGSNEGIFVRLPSASFSE